MDASLLLPDESEIISKGANFVLSLADNGLPRFRYDGMMGVVGMAGKESIGGHLHLTNFRLVFASHSVNRFTGTFSIFLPTIESMEDKSSFIVKKLVVTAPSYAYEFVIWGIPKLIEAANTARNALSATQIAQMQAAAQASPEKCGDGLKVFPPLMDLFSK